jgi:hypothetical protein
MRRRGLPVNGRSRGLRGGQVSWAKIDPSRLSLGPSQRAGLGGLQASQGKERSPSNCDGHGRVRLRPLLLCAKKRSYLQRWDGWFKLSHPDRSAPEGCTQAAV